jgi:TonB family protein
MRSPDAPTTARVTATITVGANGRVQNVTTSGDPKGYRGLASCIQQRVRSWEFPPSGGTTEFNVPFVFAAQ